MKFLSLENFRDIEIEEVAVEDSLNTACNDSNDVIKTLAIVSVDPIENVEATVRTESKQVVAGDAFGLPGFWHHKKLGQDCHALKVDGEGPEDLHDGELVVEDESQEGAGDQQEGQPELVVIIFVRRLNDKIRFHCKTPRLKTLNLMNIE